MDFGVQTRNPYWGGGDERLKDRYFSQNVGSHFGSQRNEKQHVQFAQS